MTTNRCFRMNERDLDELRDRLRDEELIDALESWIRNYAHRIDEVISQISAAFGGTQLGEGVGLFEANGLDDYASATELKRLRSSDEKTDWRRISYTDLSRCYCSPTFFDPQGFVFHLPAFLIAELNDEHPYGFIDQLFRTEEHPKGWQSLLNVEQKDAIIATFQLIVEHPNFQDDRDEIEACIARLRVT